MKTIRELRLKKQMTQAELGAFVGKTKNYIADLERGARSIDGIAAATLVGIARALGTTAEDLLDTKVHVDDGDVNERPV